MAQGNNNRREVTEFLERALARATELYEEGYRTGGTCGTVCREEGGGHTLRVSYEVWYFFRAFEYGRSAAEAALGVGPGMAGLRACDQLSA